jgi:hypothetical protein
LGLFLPPVEIVAPEGPKKKVTKVIGLILIGDFFSALEKTSVTSARWQYWQIASD